MKLSHVTLSVRNLEESLEFYQNIIGLPVKRHFASGESEIVFLGDGEIEIELVFNQSQSDTPAGSIGKNVSLGFAVASLRDIRCQLEQKGIATGDILQPNPQVRFFFTSDPNGFRIQFVEYV